MASQGKFTVLIVEDNRVFRQLLRAVLQGGHPGAVVLEADGFRQGQERVREAVPHLAFIDIGLPDGNGLDLIAWLRHEHPGVVVAICTSYDLPEYREAAAEHGVSEFLAKERFLPEHVLGVAGRAAERWARSARA